MLRFIISALLATISVHGIAEPVRIGLFTDQTVGRISFIVKSGTYELRSDSAVIFRLNAGEVVDVTSAMGKLNIWYKGAPYHGYRQLKFAHTAPNSEFRAQPGGKTQQRIYPETLEIYSVAGALKLINVIDLEKYVSGVIEAEAGNGAEPEYYKVQAIISRTYALNNLQRHAAEGFHLCDGTHCQVYHGRPRSVDLAVDATYATTDLVIVDPEINLITASFCSNCGGQTANSGDVWSKHLPYLISRPDTFCLVMPHSQWEKKIPVNEWLEYLEAKNFPVDDSLTCSVNYFPVEKEIYFGDSTQRVNNRNIRERFKLRSPYFTLYQDGDNVVFTGKGFGHGVGLCQEGAMRMAELGFSCSEIISFYYSNVHIMPRDLMIFFRE